MWGLMYVWDCPKCGELLDDEIAYNSPIIDVRSDSVEHLNLCKECGCEVKQRMSTGSDGEPIPIMEEVDDERMREFAYGDGSDDDEYVDDGDDWLD